MINTLCKLDVRLFRVLDDVLGLLFGGLHSRFLNDDGLGKVLEELIELLEGAFDMQNVVVTGADGAEDGGCSAGAVRFELLVVR